MFWILVFLALANGQFYVEYGYTDSACATQPISARRNTALDKANCRPTGCTLIASSNPPAYTKTLCPLTYSSLGADIIGHCPATPLTQWSSLRLNTCFSNRFTGVSYYMTNCSVGASITEVTFTGTLNCSGNVAPPTTTVIALNSCFPGMSGGFATWFSCTNNPDVATTTGSRTTAPAAAASLTGVVGFAFLILSILF